MALNNGQSSYDLDVPARDLFTDGTTLHNLWEAGRAQVIGERIAGATLPPRSGAMLAVD